MGDYKNNKIDDIRFWDSSLEAVAATIFMKSGYEIVREIEEPNSQRVDFIARKTDKSMYVEVKLSASMVFQNARTLNKMLHRIKSFAHDNNGIPVLVLFSTIPDEYRKICKQEYANLVILDLSNLLYATQGTNLQEKMISILPFSVEQVVPKPGEIELGWTETSNEKEALITSLDSCLSGRDSAYEFEDICFQALQYLFFDDLALWRKQQSSNKGLYRFDLLCRIKDNTEKTFWSMMERYFNSKYIIFEYKNYSDRITQKEVYTTEKYLYEKALRRVAIVITKSGYDEHSLWASKGILRENGKLVLLVDVEELKQMIKLKTNQQDPSEVLLNRLDDLLMELEK